MNLRKIISILLIFISFTLTGCQNIISTENSQETNDNISLKPEQIIGSWDDYTYTNTLFSFSLAIDSGYTILKNDEVSTKLGVPTTDGIYYDFALVDKNDINCFYLYFEDTSKTLTDSYISLDSYVNSAKINIENNSNTAYTISDYDIIQLADRDYVHFSAKDSFICYDFYITRNQSVFASIVTTTYINQPTDISVLLNLENLPVT